jgi:glycerophosphoryl diester phosphodiesterase
MLKKLVERQKTRKIIYLTIKEPWYNPDPLEPIVDRVIKLDCENDDTKEYQRILVAYEEDMKRHGH